MLKRRFVTFVSHQLRTPLVAVHQYLDVMKHLDQAQIAGPAAGVARPLPDPDRGTPEPDCRLADPGAGWRAAALFKERIKVDLSQIISDILKTYEPTAAAESVSLEARLPDKRPVRVGRPELPERPV